MITVHGADVVGADKIITVTTEAEWGLLKLAIDGINQSRLLMKKQPEKTTWLSGLACLPPEIAARSTKYPTTTSTPKGENYVPSI